MLRKMICGETASNKADAQKQTEMTNGYQIPTSIPGRFQVSGPGSL